MSTCLSTGGGCTAGTPARVWSTNGITAEAWLLAADGAEWTTAPPMSTPRSGAVACRLPGGQVIVAGGQTRVPGPVVLDVDGHGDPRMEALPSAEIWDPATGLQR